MKTKLLFPLFFVFALSGNAQAWLPYGQTQYTNQASDFATFAYNITGILYTAYVDESDNDHLKVMYHDGNQWLNLGGTVTTTGNASIPDIKVNQSTGEVWVAYRTDPATGNPRLMVKRFDGTNWVTEGNDVAYNGLIPSEKILIQTDPATGHVYVASIYEATGVNRIGAIVSNRTGTWANEHLMSNNLIPYGIDYKNYDFISFATVPNGPGVQQTTVTLRGRNASNGQWNAVNQFNPGNTSCVGLGAIQANSNFSPITFQDSNDRIVREQGQQILLNNGIQLDGESFQYLRQDPILSALIYVQADGNVFVWQYDLANSSPTNPTVGWNNLSANVNVGTFTKSAKIATNQSNGTLFLTYKDGNGLTTRVFDPNFQFPRVYVDANATGNNDGSSWADAFTDLQAGITAATNTTEKAVWVAQGTYKPTTTGSDPRNATYVVASNDIKIYGGFNGTETQLSERDFLTNQVIIDGDLASDDTASLGYNSNTRDDNAYNLFVIQANNALIDGVTIQNGHANRDVSGSRTYRGAAIYFQSGYNQFTLRNSIIKRCVTNRGGAVNTRFEVAGANELAIENCMFHDNVSAYASAVQILSTGQTVNAELNNNLFYNNISQNIPIRDGLGGSTVACFSNGAAAIFNLNMVNNTITQNIDSGNATGTDHATFVIRSSQGGTMNANLHNNNFFENYRDTNGTLNPTNIGRMNVADPLNSITFTHNNISQTTLNTYTSNYTASANIDVNPLFVDVANADFSLQSGSPLIDAGDSTQVPVSVSSDLNRNSRILGSAVDIGAFEFNNVDTTPPTVVVQDIIVQLDATGNGSIQPSDVDNGSSDNSGGGLTYSLDVSSFDCTNIGANTVTLTVTDQAGNSASDTAIVTVVDSTAPNVVAQDVTLALGPNGTVNVTAQDVDNGSTDNCGVDLILTQFSQDLFTCADLGTNTVQYLLRDSSFNVGQATVVITIVDQTAAVPDAANLVDITAQCEVTSLTAPTATDNCAGAITATSNVTLPLTASTVITWTYDDGNGNTSTQTQNVVIADTTAPTLSTQNTTVDLAGNASVSITELDVVVNSSDNCSGTVAISLSQNIFTAVGTYNVDVTATDIAGNSITQTVVVTVDDTLSIDHANKLQVKFYPNPVQTVLNIEVPDFKEARLYDLSGRIISKSSSPQIPMGDLSSGMYIIQVKDHQNRTASKRVVKK